MIEDSVENDQKHVWSVLKSRRQHKTICCELNVNGVSYTNDNNICNAWTEHYASLFKFDDTLTNRKNINSIDELLREICLNCHINDIKIEQFTFNEIKEKLFDAKSGKWGVQTKDFGLTERVVRKRNVSKRFLTICFKFIHLYFIRFLIAFQVCILRQNMLWY